MTNREAHEEAAGMGLCESFFIYNNIDPNAECVEDAPQVTVEAVALRTTAAGQQAGGVNE